MHSTVLQLDIQGTPQAWIGLEEAALHYATGSVAWEDGAGPLATLRGGWNAVSGRQSRIEVAAIVAVRGHARLNLFDVVPGVTKAKKMFTVEDHVKATEGVECRKDAGVIDEIPGAYKDIDAVMAAQADLVDVVHTLKQVLCVKG